MPDNSKEPGPGGGGEPGLGRGGAPVPDNSKEPGPAGGGAPGLCSCSCSEGPGSDNSKKRQPGDGRAGRVVPCDYDTDPGRFAANQSFRPQASLGRAVADVFGMVARRIITGEAGSPVLELGGGTGPLARELAGHGIPVVVADLAGLLSQAPRPAVRTDARAAGFQAESFGTVAALWMLYHLPDPAVALREARRVLRTGGRLVVCAPSRRNDPELAAVLPGWGQPLTFDAENAAAQVSRFFEITDAESWDLPLIDLASTADVRRYLRGRVLTEDQARRAAANVSTPVRLTKRGTLIWARKP